MRLIDADALSAQAEYDSIFRLIIPYHRLANAPTVEAEPVVHAHWENCTRPEPDFFGTPGLVPKKLCSHCKKTNKNYAPPYCPHCGAVMDEEAQK